MNHSIPLLSFCCLLLVSPSCPACEGNDKKVPADSESTKVYTGHGFEIRCLLFSEHTRSVVVSLKAAKETLAIYDFSLMNGAWALTGARFTGDLTNKSVSAELLARDQWGILLSGGKGVEGIFSLKEGAFGFLAEKAVEEYKGKSIPAPK